MNLYFFFTKLDADGFPNIYPRKTIVLELSNGLLLGGDCQQHPRDYVPPWILPPHHEIGQYNVYMYSRHQTWTASLSEQNINSHIGNALPFHLYVQMSRGRRISTGQFRLVDTHSQHSFRGTGVYVAMPDGSVYAAKF